MERFAGTAEFQNRLNQEQRQHTPCPLFETSLIRRHGPAFSRMSVACDACVERLSQPLCEHPSPAETAEPRFDAGIPEPRHYRPRHSRRDGVDAEETDAALIVLRSYSLQSVVRISLMVPNDNDPDLGRVFFKQNVIGKLAEIAAPVT